MLRLVRDDETEWTEMADQEVQSGSDVPRRRGRKGATEPADAPAEAAETAEARDGALEDSADESGDSTSSDQIVDKGALEAMLMSTHHPLTAGRLAEMLDLPSTKPIRQAIKNLNADYESSGRSFRIEQVAGGFQILTLPTFGDYLKKLHQKEGDAKLSKAALETLAIIAYKQPMLRADVEAIRGVACGETIRSLMEKHLVKIAGRAEEPGRPILYGTTKRFLELFGLNSIKELPQPDLEPKK
ncbi:MAG TPA: SMC-Scp complex subunit ScpB [Humisphaera sp.]|jgi:segregation and condensation protein B|nr:SMC-Scp complex subunit ScpB [Humisphaera sp.]